MVKQVWRRMVVSVVKPGITNEKRFGVFRRGSVEVILCEDEGMRLLAWNRMS